MGVPFAANATDSLALLSRERALSQALCDSQQRDLVEFLKSL
jgi:hypothetical protein